MEDEYLITDNLVTKDGVRSMNNRVTKTKESPINVKSKRKKDRFLGRS